jgi:hypothetical protein
MSRWLHVLANLPPPRRYPMPLTASTKYNVEVGRVRNRSPNPPPLSRTQTTCTGYRALTRGASMHTARGSVQETGGWVRSSGQSVSSLSPAAGVAPPFDHRSTSGQKHSSHRRGVSHRRVVLGDRGLFLLCRVCQPFDHRSTAVESISLTVGGRAAAWCSATTASTSSSAATRCLDRRLTSGQSSSAATGCGITSEGRWVGSVGPLRVRRPGALTALFDRRLTTV